MAYEIVRFNPERLNRNEETLEGREVLPMQSVAAKAAQEFDSEDFPMGFAGVVINSKTHVAYSGLSQFGKSSVLRLHVAPVLERIKKGSAEKVIVFDSTNDIVPFIYACLGNSPNVYLMNPKDTRCYQWDMSEDIKGASSINDAVHTLVRDKQKDEPFFLEGARGLSAGVMKSFDLGDVTGWTLRDVILATRSQRTIEQLLMKHPNRLGYLRDAFIKRSNQDIFSTLIAVSYTHLTLPTNREV